MVDGLKVLDPNRPIREADMAITLTDVRFLGDKADITVIFLYLGT